MCSISRNVLGLNHNLVLTLGLFCHLWKEAESKKKARKKERKKEEKKEERKKERKKEERKKERNTRCTLVQMFL